MISRSFLFKFLHVTQQIAVIIELNNQLVNPIKASERATSHCEGIGTGISFQTQSQVCEATHQEFRPRANPDRYRFNQSDAGKLNIKTPPDPAKTSSVEESIIKATKLIN